MKIISINMRNDSFNILKKNNWRKRLLAVIELIKEENPDIIGTQEMTFKFRKQLQYLLGINKLDYNIYGESRFQNNRFYDEYNSILVKKNIKVINSKTYSLSDTPLIPKTKFKHDIFPRIMTYIETKDFYLVNTHLANKPNNNKLLQLRCLFKLIKKDNMNNKPIIITGDFNTGYNNIKDLLEENNLIDITKNIGKTFSTKKEIFYLDHIIVSNKLQYRDVKKYINRYKGIYPSDHYPISANIIIKNTIK